MRLFVAGITELGNDEVYYWTYAQFPDWSHFDHPPMVGWIIQLFSLNLLLNSTFFVRLGAVVLGSASLYVVYRIGRDYINEKTGLIAAVLYAASPYVSIICGTFIMPDSPLILCWVTALWLGIGMIQENSGKNDHRHMLWFGVIVGLAMISKYHAAFLWIGMLSFILLFQREWLSKWSLYCAMLISALCLSPVLVWNINVDFISFTFHGDRVGLFESDIRWDYFFSELFGQVGYQNPINYVLIVISIVALIRHNNFISKKTSTFLLLQSIPIIMTFLLFSLWRRTLPHWSGPAYLSLLIIAAAYLAEFKKTIPNAAKSALALMVFVLSIAVFEIKTGFSRSFTDSPTEEITSLGKYDVTLDMSGWRFLSEKFSQIHKDNVVQNVVPEDVFMISDKWFPAAHLDFYVATPLQIPLYVFGSLNEIHKYAWINKKRTMPSKGRDAYYITHSRQFRAPDHLTKYFEGVVPLDTIAFERGGKVDAYFFIYKLEKYQSNFDSEI